MQRFECRCGSPLFFDNTQCSACESAVGWCDACGAFTTLADDGSCTREGCGTCLQPCANRRDYCICNGFVVQGGGEAALCVNCSRTSVAPNADDSQHVALWQRMESAKRRLLYELRLLGIDDQTLDEPPALTFRFMADTPSERIVTGHADGVVTINLAEANPVEREAAREQFGEPQRTIIGHLRHECGHYLWQKFVEGSRDAEFQELFGDHEQPPYGQALETYYQQGAPADWSQRYISQYASSHPWEDFAETAGFYLDMRSVLDTLAWFAPSLAHPGTGDFDQLLAAYLEAGIALNEVNRTMGLKDLVPEVVSKPAVEKLRFVDSVLTRRPRTSATEPAPSPRLPARN